MKLPIIIANWKMRLGIKESQNLATICKTRLRGLENKVEVVLCPSFISLFAVRLILAKSKIKLGAQDCFWEAKGAYTGEVSAQELKEGGCEFVIIGHSERRQNLFETDEIVHQKVKSALLADLTPIICVGETFDQRQQGVTDYILIQQTTKALEGLKADFRQRIIIAYEPVWVIGSGQAVEPTSASAANQVIRQALLDLYPAEIVNQNFSLIYGGSADRNNVKSFTDLENIDGVLVGGASIKADEFVEIVKRVVS